MLKWRCTCDIGKGVQKATVPTESCCKRVMMLVMLRVGGRVTDTVGGRMGFWVLLMR